ncbi:hypothetical protein [Streptomyces sp. Tue6028]|uniref:hypothetical protein n=1 Tax=Streptomyces sp. Tue6028 TaxID=2036037 RepID=UPI003D7278CF
MRSGPRCRRARRSPSTTAADPPRLAADATATGYPTPEGNSPRSDTSYSGLVTLAFFDALYLGAQFGAGPRDGIMTGLVRLTRLPIAAVRTGIEITVATARPHA